MLATGAAYFLYLGIEQSAGQWAYSVLLTGLPAAIARTIVSLYWVGVGAGRLLLGAIGDRLTPDRWLDVSVVAGVATGLLTLVFPPALPLFGVALAGIVPLLMIVTPARVGPALTAHAVGYQTAGGVAGGVTIPPAIGLAIQSLGPVAFGPSLALLALALAGLHGATRVRSGRAAP
jgi:fucose permease